MKEYDVSEIIKVKGDGKCKFCDRYFRFGEIDEAGWGSDHDNHLIG